MPPRVNLRSSAVKRIMQEASERADPDTDGFVASPLESDIFEWHCTLRGVKGTEYEGGLYHLRILLPASYPMSAPDIVLLTPNGRFELGKKICIDGLTSFHAGSWQPAWGVRTAITGLRAFWTQEGEALSAIGALDVPRAERRRLARLSRDWTCPTCGETNATLLPDPPEPSESSVNAEAGPSHLGGSDEAKPEPSAVNGDVVEPSPIPAAVRRLTADREPANADTSPVLPSESSVPAALAVPPSPSEPYTPPGASESPPSLARKQTHPITQAPTLPAAHSPPCLPAPLPRHHPSTAHSAAPPALASAVAPPSSSQITPRIAQDLTPTPTRAAPTPPAELRARVPRPGPPPPAPGARPVAPPRARPTGAGEDAVVGRGGAIPARFTAPPLPPPRQAPFWLDILIAGLVMLLLVLIVKK